MDRQNWVFVTFWVWKKNAVFETEDRAGNDQRNVWVVVHFHGHVLALLFISHVPLLLTYKVLSAVS